VVEGDQRLGEPVVRAGVPPPRVEGRSGQGGPDRNGHQSRDQGPAEVHDGDDETAGGKQLLRIDRVAGERGEAAEYAGAQEWPQEPAPGPCLAHEPGQHADHQAAEYVHGEGDQR